MTLTHRLVSATGERLSSVSPPPTELAQLSFQERWPASTSGAPSSSPESHPSPPLMPKSSVRAGPLAWAARSRTSAVDPSM